MEHTGIGTGKVQCTMMHIRLMNADVLDRALNVINCHRDITVTVITQIYGNGTRHTLVSLVYNLITIMQKY